MSGFQFGSSASSQSTQSPFSFSNPPTTGFSLGSSASPFGSTTLAFRSPLPHSDPPAFPSPLPPHLPPHPCSEHQFPRQVQVHHYSPHQPQPLLRLSSERRRPPRQLQLPLHLFSEHQLLLPPCLDQLQLHPRSALLYPHQVRALRLWIRKGGLVLCGGGFMLRDGGVGFCFAAVGGGGGGSRSLSRDAWI
uniref:Uncharacterized protein n=1 Tax=Fagus sylvatica TaxID=28930 RepID=A0A2N9ICT7_FAGSY